MKGSVCQKSAVNDYEVRQTFMSGLLAAALVPGEQRPIYKSTKLAFRRKECVLCQSKNHVTF